MMYYVSYLNEEGLYRFGEYNEEGLADLFWNRVAVTAVVKLDDERNSQIHPTHKILATIPVTYTEENGA
jgi:hypothetical protein